MALVNYTDEWLATHNKLPKKPDIHKKVGSVLLISTLMSFVGATVILVITKNVSISFQGQLLAIISAVPMVIMYASYFYLLQNFPVHQVAPVFQIASAWLLLIGFLYGEVISVPGLLGVLVLMYGAYIMDAGTFKWKIPTKLLLISIPATLSWALSVFLVRLAAEGNSAVSVTYWQMMSIGTIGIFLIFAVKKYREGLIFRLKNQGKAFLGLSLVNETFAETGYLFSNLAIALAPVAAYVTAMGGIQSIFVLLLFFFFPQGNRNRLTRIHWVAIALIALGVFLIELR